MTLPPDTAALVERLRKGRLVRQSEPMTISEHGIAWSGEVRELPHPDALEAAVTIEAQACRIEELTTGLQTIGDAEFVDVMCDPGWAIRYSKDVLARANGARDEGEG